jgi:hypothetical protein
MGMPPTNNRHPGEGRDPSGNKRDVSGIAHAAQWIPAFAGMTDEWG